MEPKTKNKHKHKKFKKNLKIDKIVDNEIYLDMLHQI